MCVKLSILIFIYYTGKIKECQEPLGTQSYDKCCNNYSNTKSKHTGTSHIAIMPDSLISEKCIRCRMARFKRFKDFHRLYLFYNYGTSYHTQQGLSSTLFCGGSVYSIPIFGQICLFQMIYTFFHHIVILS